MTRVTRTISREKAIRATRKATRSDAFLKAHPQPVLLLEGAKSRCNPRYDSEFVRDGQGQLGPLAHNGVKAAQRDRHAYVPSARRIRSRNSMLAFPDWLVVSI